jgi:hypothetical protein
VKCYPVLVKKGKKSVFDKGGVPPGGVLEGSPGGVFLGSFWASPPGEGGGGPTG